jgi:RHS repeat-associated protein
MILDQTGTLANVKRHDYLPFGEELFAPAGGRTVAMGYASGDGVRQQLTSKERDIDTGLDYFLARYYSPSQGRFTSVDPENYQAMLDIGDPQSWNGYAYVNNNPLVRIDSDGRGFFKKLWNKIRWDVYGEDADVEAEEKRRRQFLYDNSFTKDAQGNWQHVDFSHLSRDDLWVAYAAWQDKAADPNTYRLTADEIANALPAGGTSPATGSIANRGPAGRVSTEKYLENNWDKGTFGNVQNSIKYHLRKHGQGLSEVEYTKRAIRVFNDTTAVRSRVSDIRGRAVFKVVSKEGTGLFTKTGRIIWFHPKL